MASEYLYPATELPMAAAAHIGKLLLAAIDAKGHCYCALSGGSSPKAMLSQLASLSLPWKSVTILMVDERITEQTADQNQTMLNAFLEEIIGPKPKLVPLLMQKASPQDLLSSCNGYADTLPDKLDVVVLGMGMDGHTASLFPDSSDYDQAMSASDRYVLVTPGAAPHQRLSMSFHWIKQTANLILYIPGKEKLERLHQIIEDPDFVSPIKALNAQAHLSVFSSED